MTYIKLKDGTVAHVRMGKRGAKPTAKDVEALESVVHALRTTRCPACKRMNTITEGVCEDCGWERTE